MRVPKTWEEAPYSFILRAPGSPNALHNFPFSFLELGIGPRALCTSGHAVYHCVTSLAQRHAQAQQGPQRLFPVSLYEQEPEPCHLLLILNFLGDGFLVLLFHSGPPGSERLSLCPSACTAPAGSVGRGASLKVQICHGPFRPWKTAQGISPPGAQGLGPLRFAYVIVPSLLEVIFFNCEQMICVFSTELERQKKI